jgi:hypothetical protein
MKRAVWISASLAVVVLIAGLLWWWQTPKWPDFAQAASDQPQVVVQVDRDYAYHIGDLITFDVFLKQQADVSLDASTLAVRGDFELVGKPQVVASSVEEGVTRQHVRIQVQSFVGKPELKLEASFAYKKGDQRLDLAVPPQSFFTSKTWDGRKQLKEGDDPRVPFYWYAMRSIAPLTLGSLAFLVLCLVSIRARILSRPKVSVDLTKVQVTELLVRVRDGRGTREDHKLLDGAMRFRFNVGPVPVAQIDTQLGNGHLADFLRYNAPAVYSNEPITESERKLIAQYGELILKSW